MTITFVTKSNVQKDKTFAINAPSKFQVYQHRYITG